LSGKFEMQDPRATGR